MTLFAHPLRARSPCAGYHHTLSASNLRQVRRRGCRHCPRPFDITGWPASKIARAGLVRTFQLMRPFESMSVLENVTIAALSKRKSRKDARQHALDVLDRVQLSDQVGGKVSTMSTAGLKRLELARALAMEPRVVLLDEVLAGLVPAERAPMIELLRTVHQQGQTVLFVEHIMAAVMALSERLVVMHEGAVLTSGDPRTVVADDRVVEAYLGEEKTA